MNNVQIHIVCPSCLAVNRLSKTKLSGRPKCGKCQKALFTGKPVALDDVTFSKFTSRTEIPVVVDFWASWCGPCIMMAPNFEKAAQQMEPQVRFAKVDTEHAVATASQFAIRSIPTIMVFKNGKIVGQQAGAMGLPDLISWVNRYAGGV